MSAKLVTDLLRAEDIGTVVPALVTSFWIASYVDGNEDLSSTQWVAPPLEGLDHMLHSNILSGGSSLLNLVLLSLRRVLSFRNSKSSWGRFLDDNVRLVRGKNSTLPLSFDSFWTTRLSYGLPHDLAYHRLKRGNPSID